MTYLRDQKLWHLFLSIHLEPWSGMELEHATSERGLLYYCKSTRSSKEAALQIFGWRERTWRWCFQSLDKFNCGTQEIPDVSDSVRNEYDIIYFFISLSCQWDLRSWKSGSPLSPPSSLFYPSSWGAPVDFSFHTAGDEKQAISDMQKVDARPNISNSK